MKRRGMRGYYTALFLLIIAALAVAVAVLRDVPPITAEDGADSIGNNEIKTAITNGQAQGNNETENGFNNEAEPAPVFIWREIPPYIPAQPTNTDHLSALINYALNRLRWAQAEGANVQTGRYAEADLRIFRETVQRSQNILNDANPADILTEISVLQSAIDRFHHAVIDPADRYRPFLPVIARGEDEPQKHHLRAVWIATVVNIDWPSAEARGTSPAHVDRQKDELRQRFEEIADLGFNAVVFQISPTGDALYRSEISPWSAWLTGETNFTGELLDSNGTEFDPLAYAIRLAREHNIEFHAWFNPYRVTHIIESYRGITLSSTGEPVTALSQIRHEWAQIPGTAFYLFGDYVKLGENRYVVDPAAPGVREWIVRRVLEVVENYDIDAVHFDDYFYPSDFPIADTFARYNASAFPDTAAGRANFRREQTEKMIIDVGTAIRAAAPWVKFGISPGGVWKSAAEGNTGLNGGGFDAGTGSPSATTWSNYHSSFADTRRWVIENYIDYLTPQIYWEWTHTLAPYGVIADWWARLFEDYGPHGHLRNSHGAHTNAQLYIGVGLYRMYNQYRSNPTTIPMKWRNSPGFENEGMRTLLRQEAYNLGNPNIRGSMFFSQNQMRPGRGQGMRDTMENLRQTLWRYPALVPPMPHLGGTAPSRPANVLIGGDFIAWKNTEDNPCPTVAPRYFVIYRSPHERINLDNPANILAIVPATPGEDNYRFDIPGGTGDYFYTITAVNRLHDESAAG
ncbi:MAG: family 10 glycosylhydrolase [Defluviitaleaceae bacterium]|nr:family 10 glycosylhydrolase [Defluviitaleaceae bacterium]